MLLEIFTKDSDNKEEKNFLKICIDGRQQLYVYDSVPGNNTLSGSFSQCFMIASLLQKMYRAGKEDEPLEVKFIEV